MDHSKFKSLGTDPVPAFFFQGMEFLRYLAPNEFYHKLPKPITDMAGNPYMDVSKNRGVFPKMDGEHNGSKPCEQMDDLGGFPIIFGLTPI